MFTLYSQLTRQLKTQTCVRYQTLQAWLHKTAVHVEVERTLESPKSSVDMSTNTAMKVHMCTLACHTPNLLWVAATQLLWCSQW
jgi:hypothetical protein